MNIYTVMRSHGDVILRRDNAIITPERSLSVANHSPDGFEFGYGGSGPAQLAIAILLDHTNDKELSERLRVPFTIKFIATEQGNGFSVTSKQIDEFLEKNKPVVSEVVPEVTEAISSISEQA